MKTLSTFFLSFALLFIANTGFAQAKKETFTVAGECGMCQKTIEKAAKSAGATAASWNTETKALTVSYNSKKSNTSKIQQAIAASGYDTPGFKASDESYNKLHACCKYERSDKSATSCCDSEACKTSACMTNGHCKADQACCKDSGCADKACCKKS